MCVCVCVMSWTQEPSRLPSTGSLNSMMVICALVSKLLEGRAHLIHSHSYPNTFKKKGEKVGSLKKSYYG